MYRKHSQHLEQERVGPVHVNFMTLRAHRDLQTLRDRRVVLTTCSPL